MLKSVAQSRMAFGKPLQHVVNNGNGAKQRAANDIMSFESIPCPHTKQGAEDANILRQRFVLTEKIVLHQIHINRHKNHIPQPFREADMETAPEVLRGFRQNRHIKVCRNVQAK